MWSLKRMTLPYQVYSNFTFRYIQSVEITQYYALQKHNTLLLGNLRCDVNKAYICTAQCCFTGRVLYFTGIRNPSTAEQEQSVVSGILFLETAEIRTKQQLIMCMCFSVIPCYVCVCVQQTNGKQRTVVRQHSVCVSD